MATSPKPLMEIPDVEFREETHQYFFNGIEIPGISYILKTSGFIDYGKVSKSVLEDARERGDHAHYAARLYDEDNPTALRSIEVWEKQCLAEPLDPWVRARLKGWLKFRREWEFIPALIEKPLSCQMHGMMYGMTPDRCGVSKLGRSVFEIKATAKLEVSHGIQTAFQVQAFKKEGETTKRFAVQLLENDFKLHEFNDRQEERIAGCILAATHYKWLKGIK